jgi:Pyrimidine 5'-nucleotidase (UMPH-1)
MGDILDDVKMVRDTHHEVILKIGYLNDLEHNSHLTEEFSKTFDIVITGDGSLQPVNYLLSKVFVGEQSSTITKEEQEE